MGVAGIVVLRSTVLVPPGDRPASLALGAQYHNRRQGMPAVPGGQDMDAATGPARDGSQLDAGRALYVCCSGEERSNPGLCGTCRWPLTRQPPGGSAA